MAQSDSKSSGVQSSEPSVVYPNAPLAEVVFEIRFAGEPAVECRRHDFYQVIRSDFPVVAVPNVEPGQAIAMQPYHFKSEDGASTIMLAINRFAFSTRSYGGFSGFSGQAVSLVERFCNMFAITKLNRTGLRYVDVIPFVRHSGRIPLARYFTLSLKSPALESDEFYNVSLAFEIACGNGFLTTRVTTAKSADGIREVLVLDFDFAKTHELEVRHLRDYLTESHDHTKRVFEAILTEDYKSVMRGEAVE